MAFFKITWYNIGEEITAGKGTDEPMKKERLLPAIDKLADIFDHIDWQYVLGYSNSSNFYKAFRGYYHASPREYQ